MYDMSIWYIFTVAADRSSSEQKKKGRSQGTPNWWIVMNKIYAYNTDDSFVFA